MLKILLTGNSGFIGYNVGNYLFQHGYVIEGISRKKTHQNYFTHTFDLQNSNFINKFKSKNDFDVVIHCASLTEEIDITSMFNNNVFSTLNVLEFCKLKNIKKFILISGHNVYAPSNTPINEKSKILPSTNYGLTKLLQENLAQFYAENHSINTIILRLSYTYGSNQSAKKMIPSIINKYMHSQPIILNKFKNGFQKIDVVNIHDVCQAILKALKTKKQFDVFNIAYGKSITVKDILEILRQNIKSNSSISVKQINEKTNHYNYDISHAQKILNFKPAIDLEKGIKQLMLDSI